MKIEKNTAVTLRFKVSELNGKLLEETRQPVAYLHGGYGNVLPKIEEALEGQTEGYKVTLDLQPQDAFGERDERLVRTIPKSQFPPGVKVGGQLTGRDQEGNERAFMVKKIKGQEVFLDGNHPLAGTALRFVVTVLGVRVASDEEIEHGHVHGDGGHDH
jgi:FKBP-type peptidyl-prolyl cis-trans isomerase SlyD